MTRKEKADNKRAKRQTPTIQGTAIEASTPSVDVSPDLSKPEEIAPARPVESVDANTSPVVGQAVTQNATPAPVNSATKPLTFSDMLEAQRQNIVKDKTDAVKMQKYYALTDALKALGQMGGAAVGGAIGGGVLDSAPSVPEYKESRGYLDAVERARKANDRLRALDEQGFNLAYSKQQRDEERAYNEKTRAEERAYQAEQNKLNREYQAEQARITREWNKAVADGDFARKAELEKELLSLKNKYAAADDQRSRDYLQKQYDLYNRPQPVMFSDGTIANLTSDQLTTMFDNYEGKKVGGVEITKDNFGKVLRNNPAEFAGYLKMIGATANPMGYTRTVTPKDSEQGVATKKNKPVKSQSRNEFSEENWRNDFEGAFGHLEM